MTVGVPLLESKLHIPRRRRGLVPRLRLERRLDITALPPVVVVSAPAGFGKTTLLTEWLATDTEPGQQHTAWLSLDRRDSDPSIYWSYVVAALRKVVPDVGADALAALPSSPLESVVATLLNDLAALDSDVVLVLDDYHVIESVEVQESMRFLVEHLPPQLHLLVATRADPPWPLAALRARGDLLEVRAADLRFTGAEASAYLNDAMGLTLSAGDIDALEDRTEGWIAALQLAALSLQGRDDPAAFIAGFAGDDRFVVDYLADEVLDRQPKEIRTFLLQTSILNRLSASLCAAVTGCTDAKAILDTVERSNLFLVALDDRRQWYRYHHLFGDVLRARLLDEHPDPTELHQRASQWFEANGEPVEAVRHAMEAADYPRAARLVELGLPALRQARLDSTQRQWLDALPPEIFENRPVLTIGLIGAHMVTGDVAGIDELVTTVERWLDPDCPKDDMVVYDQSELPRLPGQAAMYRAGLALLHGELPAAIAHGQRAADLAATDDHLGRGAAAALIGLAQWAGGNLQASARQYAAAIAEFETAQFFADILGCSLGLADMQVAQGHLTAAERTLTAGLDLAAAHGPLRGTADMHVGLAELHIERNELDAAAEHLRISLSLGEHLALPQHTYRWRVVDAGLRSINGDHAGALDLLRQAEHHYNTDYSPKTRPVTATTARVRLAAGDVEGALRWADGSGLSADDESAYLHEYEHLTVARVLLAADRAVEAAPLLTRLLAAAEAGGREGSAIEALLLLAAAHQAMGDTGPALDALEAALIRAQADHFIRVFLDTGPPMTTLLQLAVRHGRAPDQASALLAAGVVSSALTNEPASALPSEAPSTAPSARSNVPSSTAVSASPPQRLVDELSRRELDVLRLLRTDLSGPEIAAELMVSLNTVRTHTRNIFMKLGVTNRRSAVRRADELSL